MKNGRKEAADKGRRIDCAICKRSIDENDWYFSAGKHEKAICLGCVKELCPSGNVGRILENGGIKIEWRIAS